MLGCQKTTNNRFTTGQGFTYDFDGNLIADNQGRQFIFNGDNKQTQVKDANNVPIGTYEYDGTGARVKKITASETTIFVYNAGGRLLAEYSTQTASNPTISYLTQDNLGSPRVITDNGGNVASRRDFQPFGEELNANSTLHFDYLLQPLAKKISLLFHYKDQLRHQMKYQKQFLHLRQLHLLLPPFVHCEG